MEIIKHGTAYEELDSYSCKCPKCDCEFKYVKGDVHSYLNEECYVICPECFSDIKLPDASAKDINNLIVNLLEDLDLQIDESAAYSLEVAKVQRLIRDKIDELRGE